MRASQRVPDSLFPFSTDMLAHSLHFIPRTPFVPSSSSLDALDPCCRRLVLSDLSVPCPPGRWNGKGTFTFGKSQDEYVGEVHRGKFHGVGTLTYKRGGFYEGSFKVCLLAGLLASLPVERLPCTPKLIPADVSLSETERCHSWCRQATVYERRLLSGQLRRGAFSAVSCHASPMTCP